MFVAFDVRLRSEVLCPLVYSVDVTHSSTACWKVVGSVCDLKHRRKEH